ncbi:hypothetical protein AMTR_s00013p00253300 [Amborella trichopoda]|uniref:Uncharacterized protein n=1 Tax=Amborella trichopoda TaxID=13333 RepID=W1PQI3_AMBTC|nr:hypothetical protein AMTR_s00013p00253300 [Amborella trichopoda]
MLDNEEVMDDVHAKEEDKNAKVEGMEAQSHENLLASNMGLALVEVDTSPPLNVIPQEILPQEVLHVMLLPDDPNLQASPIGDSDGQDEPHSTRTFNLVHFVSIVSSRVNFVLYTDAQYMHCNWDNDAQP